MRIIIILLCLVTVDTYSQNSDTNRLTIPRNSISLEIAGNAFLFGSLNYERVFQISENFYISGRVGVGAYLFNGGRTINVPILVNAIYHVYHVLSVEAGVGSTLFFKKVIQQDGDNYNLAKESGLDPLITGLIGVRLQHPGKGFCFRFGFTPLIETRKTDPFMFSAKFIPIGGFSFGYSF
jgi:hypothetical protein